MGNRFLLIILFFQCFLFETFAEDWLNKASSAKGVKVPMREGCTYTASTAGDSVIVTENNPNKIVEVIIEFYGEPLFVNTAERGLLKQRKANCLALQSRLSSDIEKLYGSVEASVKINLKKPQKIREFYKLFNGVVYKVPECLLNGIAALSYVKSIHHNNQVKADLKESVHLIGADSVWAFYKNKGDSIVIGVIDTGIDYLHPALGGGFGKGYKVIGGYDFINNDNDPMDDKGHGTHVAGIIAGNSDSIKGVAPNALLLAFKVLNSEGRGTQGTVIAGIERAVDPNDDDDYSDKADVINISLGGNGNPYDPVSTAADNAVSLGVICCVAAGNDGAYNYISSPGCAKNVITIGACTKSDQAELYSSGGPSLVSYAIKPDVVAPGSDIYSSLPGNKYDYNSGTSMAAPHVAGLCALLKKQFKDWNPEKIKSAIMTSAKDIGSDPMKQGSGRIDAVKAFNTTSFAIPSSLSFGIDTMSVGSWIKRDTVIISNINNSIQTYNISIKGLSGGINITAIPSSFSLNPGTEQRVIFELCVNNALVKKIQTGNFSYSGTVEITGGKDYLRIPWAFVKTNVLALHFDYPVVEYMDFRIDRYSRLVNLELDFTNPNLSETIIPEGTYSICFKHENIPDPVSKKNSTLFLMKENIKVDGYTSIDVKAAEAKNELIFAGIDENGRALDKLENVVRCVLMLKQSADKKETADMVYCTNNSDLIIKCNDLSDSIITITGQTQQSFSGEQAARIIQYPAIKGLKSNIKLTNKSTDFYTGKVKLFLGTKCDSLALLSSYYYNYNGTYGSIGFSNSTSQLSGSQWTGNIHITRQPNQDFGFSGALSAFSNVNSGDDLAFHTEPFRVIGDSISMFSFGRLTSGQLFFKNNGSIELGSGIVTNMVYYMPQNDLTQLYLSIFSFGQAGEHRDYNDSRILTSLFGEDGKLIRVKSGKSINLDGLKTGRYSITIVDPESYFGRMRGSSTVNSRFLLEKNLGVPTLTQARIINSLGEPVSRFARGEKGYLFFSAKSKFIAENIDTSASKVFFRKHGTENWIEEKVKISKDYDWVNGFNSYADISSQTKFDSCAVDVKICIKDINKNEAEYIYEPAFLIGNYMTGVENNSGRINAIPKEYKLFNNYPNPFNPSTKIEYDLPVKSFVTIIIYDLLGREVKSLVNNEEEAGKHVISFSADRLSSGVYLLKLKAGGYSCVKKMCLLK